MANPSVKTSSLKNRTHRLNYAQVPATIDAAAHVILPQHHAMFTLYMGELVTFAQAIEMRYTAR